MNDLTEHQLFVYYAIQYFIEKNGYSPTVREICKMTGLNSTATVFYHLQILKRKGYISYIETKSRTIRIIKKIRSKKDDNNSRTNAYNNIERNNVIES